MEDKNKTQQPENKPAIIEKNITDNILARVNELESTGGLSLPKNYSAANALKSAWLILQNTLDKDKRPALSVCTKDSIANCLLDMVVQGLSPAKRQCYFIVYGNVLTLSRSYFGSIAVTKGLKGIKDVFANIIYEGDEFEYEMDLTTGLKKISKHVQKFENIDITKIKGAYAVVIREGLPPYVEIMNMKQIRSAWEQGKAGGNSGAHVKFTDEMAKKSVINRACKMIWNTSDDSDILIEAIHKSTDVEDLPETDYVEESDKLIAENANKVEIDIQPEAEKPEIIIPDAWESPIKVLAMIEGLNGYKTALSWRKENLARLESFGGKDAEAIWEALEKKIQELKTAAENKQAPFKS